MLQHSLYATLFALLATAEPGYPGASLLIEATELARPEVAKQLRILDVRPKAKYAAGHLPGAVWVDHDGWSKAFNTDTGVAGWSQRIGGVGVGKDTKVVVYDEDSNRSAARIWWQLRYFGIQDVRVLNGGWTAWQAAGGKADKEEVKVATVALTLTPEAARLATKDQVLDILKGKSLQIIDARSKDEHCGDKETAKRNGAMPDAKNLEWIDLIDAKTQKFKSFDELAKVFKAANIDPTKPSVTYCQSGGRAAVMAFALELMGGKEVKNYYRSWAEWGNAEDTPIVKPKR